jgi:hypothetical protein
MAAPQLNLIVCSGFRIVSLGSCAHPANMSETVIPGKFNVEGRLTLTSGESYRIPILRGALSRGGTALFYRCPWCRKPRRFLYLQTRSGDELNYFTVRNG